MSKDYISLDCIKWGNALNIRIGEKVGFKMGKPCCYYCHKLHSVDIFNRVIHGRVYTVCCHVKKICLKSYVSG